MRVVTTLLLLVVLSGCGDATTTPQDTSSLSPVPSPPIVTTADGEPMVTCGGPPGWPASVMAEGLDGALTSAEMVEAFRQLLADPELSPELELTFLKEGAEGTEARVLARDGDDYVLGLGHWTAQGPEEGALIMGLGRTANGWEWRGGGSCAHLGPLLDNDHTWVQVAAPVGDLDRRSRTVRVSVSEMTCASARDPGPFLDEPVVVEDPDKVVVYWTSRPPREATCPGNPWVERTIELAEPLGDRPLLDGRLHPPRPVVPTEDGLLPQ